MVLRTNGRKRAATLAGLSWAGVTWAVASVNRSNALLGLGLLVAPMLVPWVVLQITELPTRWRPGHRKSIVAVAFVGIGLSGVLRALMYEPLLDLNCGPFCGHGPVLLTSNIALSAALAAVASWTTMLVCAVVGIAILFRLLASPVAGVRANAPAVLVIGAVVALLTTALVGISRLAAPISFDITLVLTVEGGACVAVAVAVLLVTWDRRTVRRNVAEVASLLGAQDDLQSVEGILSRAVGDPDLPRGLLDG